MADGVTGSKTAILETGDIYTKTLYNSSGVNTLSDKNEKNDIITISDDFAQKIIEGVNPVSFKYKNGTSGRTHYGFIAQELEELLHNIGISTNDFSPLVKEYPTKTIENENGETTVVYDYNAIPKYYVRYEEMVAFLYKYCQILGKTCKLLEDKINKIDK